MRRLTRPLARTAAVALLGAALVAPGTLPATAHAGATDEPAPASSGALGAPSGVVTTWNAHAGEAAVAACLAPLDNPLHESRMYAMVHVAVHDALNAIDRRYRSYAYHATAPEGTSVHAAVATAAHRVMVTALQELTPPFDGCAPAALEVVGTAYDDAMSSVPGGPSRTDGVAVGAAAADAILGKRSDDGSDTPLVVTDHPTGTRPGQWRFTPDRPFAFAPGWGEVELFTFGHADHYRPRPPHRLSSRRYAADLAEVRALGGDGVTTPTARTAEQTEIAYFWLESSPLAWNRIARTLADSQDLDEWEAARLHGLLNLALADGYVASFDTKYTDDFWRPVTAIRAADRDGNRRTSADPTWTPLVTTPPIPDHDSAHAVEGAAAAAVFRGFFRTDGIPFSACSLQLEGSGCTDASPTLRHFGSFSAAARENADSRVYIGFHFRNAVEAGYDHGRRIGKATVRHELRPVRGRR